MRDYLDDYDGQEFQCEIDEEDVNSESPFLLRRIPSIWRHSDRRSPIEFISFPLVAVSSFVDCKHIVSVQKQVDEG